VPTSLCQPDAFWKDRRPIVIPNARSKAV
jgi:hypothetical protein